MPMQHNVDVPGVTINLCGKLEIKIGSQIRDYPETKPFELLAYVACYGGRVSVPSVVDALWVQPYLKEAIVLEDPHGALAQAKRALKTELCKLAGLPDVPEMRQAYVIDEIGYVTLHLDCLGDTLAFWGWLGEAEEARRRGKREREVEALRGALGSYQKETFLGINNAARPGWHWAADAKKALDEKWAEAQRRLTALSDRLLEIPPFSNTPETPAGYGSSHAPCPGSPYLSQWYVPWDAEERSARQSLHNSRMLTVRGPKSGGKTWLLSHLAAQWQAEHASGRVVWIDLKPFDTVEWETIDAFCEAFSRRFFEEEGASEPPRAHAQGGAPVFRLGLQIKRFLEERNMPVLLVVDSLHELAGHAYHGDILRMLRGWLDNKRPPWTQLRLMCALSTMYSLPREGSPMNLSEPIVLHGFRPAQLDNLASHFGLQISPEEQKALLQSIGGNPYLLGMCLRDAANRKLPMQRILEEILDNPNGSDFGRYLGACMRWLEENDHLGLIAAMRQALQRPTVTLANELDQKLQYAGLLRWEHGAYVMPALFQVFFERYLAGRSAPEPVA